MYLTSEKKSDIFAKHGGNAANTGSAEGQIALFTFISSYFFYLGLYWKNIMLTKRIFYKNSHK